MHPRLIDILKLLLGIVFFLFMLWINPFGLEEKAAITLAIATLMITWWVNGAMPMPVVALLPLVLFPLFGIATMKELAPSYANPIIFLFMGGFMIALAIEKWNLHKRGALSIIKLTGTSGNKIVLGFILASGLMSMWISNTATTMMMYPIALSVIGVMEEHSTTTGNIKHLSVSLMLAVAYSSNFGGIATIIGTPPNVAYTAYLQDHMDMTIQFADWMKLCLPISLLLLIALYFVTTRILYPNHIKDDAAAKKLIHTELKNMGKLSKTEHRVLLVFVVTALLWITKGLINKAQSYIVLNDSLIALLGGISMFLIPSGNEKSKRLLVWEDTSKMAWGILILFGGGISLAGQLQNAGIIQSLGEWMSTFASGGLLLVFIVVIVSIFISEVMSNVAQVIVFAPVITSLALALKIDPIQIGIAMTLGASCASMMPMGTPPNAIVFASGKLKLKDMTTTGLVMNIISAILITAFCWYALPHMIHVLG